MKTKKNNLKRRKTFRKNKRIKKGTNKRKNSKRVSVILKKQIGGNSKPESIIFLKLDEELKIYKFNPKTYKPIPKEGLKTIKDQVDDVIDDSQELTKGQSGAQVILINNDGVKKVVKYYASKAELEMQQLQGGGSISFTKIWPKIIRRKKTIEKFHLNLKDKVDVFAAAAKKENSSLVQIYCDDDDSFTKIKKLYSARFPNFIGAKSPKRHNDFVYKYDGFYLYADILSCLYDLYLSYIKAVARTTEEVVAEEAVAPAEEVEAAVAAEEDEAAVAAAAEEDEVKKNEKIITKCMFNEIIIQRILRKYFIKNDFNKNYLVNFEDFECFEETYETDYPYILQELLGHSESETLITDLSTYVDHFVSIDTPKDYNYIEKFFSYILFEMMGIDKKDLTAKNFFDQFKNFIESKDTTVLNYLINFKKESFFYTMRKLFEELGFLHLDFKMKNIFLRYTEDKPVDHQYEKYSLVIADLDKSRLQVPTDIYDKLFISPASEAN
jgi:hypothetical protein